VAILYTKDKVCKQVKKNTPKRAWKTTQVQEKCMKEDKEGMEDSLSPDSLI
jgi:hypothetical protein